MCNAPKIQDIGAHLKFEVKSLAFINFSIACSQNGHHEHQTFASVTCWTLLLTTHPASSAVYWKVLLLIVRKVCVCAARELIDWLIVSYGSANK